MTQQQGPARPAPCRAQRAAARCRAQRAAAPCRAAKRAGRRRARPAALTIASAAAARADIPSWQSYVESPLARYVTPVRVVSVSGNVTAAQTLVDGRADGSATLTYAWSRGATAALSQWVLGVAPTSPGFATWEVAPHVGDLAWTEGRVPTPHGPIDARSSRGAGDQSFVLSVAAPAGTRGSVVVPLLGAERTITRDGAIAWTAGAPRNGVNAHLDGDGDGVVFEDQSGSHIYAWPVGTAIGGGGSPRSANLVALSGPGPVSCADRSAFTFRLHHPRGQRIVKVTVTINGHPIRTVRGRNLTRLSLRRLPQGRFVVTICTLTDLGTRATSVRTYLRCTKTPPRNTFKPARHHRRSA